MDILLVEQRIRDFAQKLTEKQDVSQRTSSILNSIENEMVITDRAAFKNYFNDLYYIKTVLEIFSNKNYKPPITDIETQNHLQNLNSEKQAERQFTIRKLLDEVINVPVRVIHTAPR